MRNPNHVRLLYEWKKNPENSAYHNIFIFRLSGALIVEHLKVAIDNLPRYYPELGAYLELNENEPSKRLAHDLHELNIAETNADEKQVLKELDVYLHQPFDLRSPPLYRHKLIKLAAYNNVYLLGLCWYHLIDDAVSVTLLTEKISQLYNHAAQGETIKISTLHHPDEFDFSVSEEGIEYWKQKCKTIQHTEVKLAQQSRVELPNHPSKRLYFNLDPTLSKHTLAFSADRGCTLFITLMAAFMAICQRFSQQDEITLLYSVSTRKKKDVHAVGFHVNNIPMNVIFTPELTFDELISIIKTQRDQDTRYQNVPLLEITKLLREEGKKVKFNFLMSQFTNLSFPLNLKDINCESIPIVNNHAKNDFTFFYHYQHQTIFLEFEYRIDLYHADFIEQLKHSFQTLLASAINAPKQALQKLPLLNNSEYEKIVFDWNESEPLNYALQSLPALFAKTVARFPHQTALVQRTQKLSYLEVDQLSNKLAYYFKQQGINKGAIIALQTEREISTILAILAIFKIGGIYLPIDPHYPQERIDYILKDSNPQAVFTSQDLNTILNGVMPVKAGIQSIELDLQDACYLFYTSGSTGKPKGVLNHYEGFVNRLCWMTNEYRFSSSDCFLQKTSYSFDVSLWEIFVPLLSGATLALADHDSHKDPTKLITHIKEYHVTVIHFVPTMLQAFLNSYHETLSYSLKMVICSGEELHYQTVAHFKEQFQNVKLLNLYGPTETSIEVTVWDTDQSINNGMVPIGYALPRVKLYILDEQMQPVPLGMSGELYIGGIAVTRGYYQHSKLNNERFINNPFTHDGSKIYKTGDICRWISPRNVEYLGRNDRQIKLNGFRIEIGEIESKLLSNPAVLNCTVIYANVEQRPKLIAFIVKQSEVMLDQNTVRDYLKAFLPIYMIPTKFVFVENIPTTTQGKINAEALLTLAKYNTEQTANVIELSNDQRVPLKIRQIWSIALGCAIDQITPESNFIDLGGDSLSVLRVIASIEKEYGCEIPLSSLLDYPRLIDFNNWLLKHLNETPIHFKEILKETTQTNYPLSQIQFSLLKAKNNNIVISFLCHGQLNLERLASALDKMIQRHALLQVNFLEINNHWYYQQRAYPVLAIQPVARPELQQTATEVEKNWRLRKTNYTNDALFFITVLTAENKHILLFYFNHMIVDRASMELIIKETLDFYKHSVTTDIPEPGNYADFVIREQRVLESQHDKQIQYWLQLLANQKRNIFIDKDHTTLSTAAAIYQTTLELSASQAIDSIAAIYHKTPFCVLSTIFMLALTEFLQETQFTLGFTISKRNTSSLENTVGPIIHYGILLSPARELPLSNQLDWVERHIINAYENCDISLAAIQNELHQYEKKQTTFNSLFDIFFDYDPAPIVQYSLPDMTLSALPITHSDSMQRFISVRIYKQNDGYGMEIRYRTALFTENDISLLIQLFQDNLIREHDDEQSNDKQSII